MRSATYTVSIFAHLLVFCIFLDAVAANTDGVVSGEYVVVDQFGVQNCSTLSISQSDTDIPADQITYGNDKCTGGNIRFDDILDDYDFASSFLSKLLSGSGSNVTCGEQTFYTPNIFYAFRFRQVPQQSVFDLAAERIGITFDVDKLEKDREYLASEYCLWGRDGPIENSDDDSIFSCFPPTATVRLQNGQILSMDTLRTGHRVQTGRNRYSTVFAWTHRSPYTTANFIRIFTSNTKPLILSPTHYVYNAHGQLLLASSVKVGHTLLDADGANLTVRFIDQITTSGLYNPQTLDGDIVVDAVHVSTYTKAVHPAAAHALLSPVRAAARLFSITTFLSE